MKRRKPNFFRELFKSFEGTVGFAILCVMVFFAIFAPMIAPYDPYDITQRGRRLQPPSRQHIMGTDWYGVDIFSQIVYGARTSLTVGALTAVGVTVIGGFLGVTAATFGRGVDVLIMRIVDFVMVLPGLPIMIMIMTTSEAAFGRSCLCSSFLVGRAFRGSCVRSCSLKREEATLRLPSVPERVSGTS